MILVDFEKGMKEGLWCSIDISARGGSEFPIASDVGEDAFAQTDIDVGFHDRLVPFGIIETWEIDRKPEAVAGNSA
ncbi:hypothetical protein [Hankyongella ginsenosidimutans]|uniref:hypothetical protein n=1 Tax=Hankyongella ginsenosidimutans TaxID=1763828 RepID=UPI001FE8C900|nr:hypothetical protein [Hankyongella ginsenosidimutans]